ncbi:MAG: diaminopimelate epimerase [Acidobacteriota bacterium]
MTFFYKVSGGGNDFLALAEPDETPPPERIRAWCRRGVSVGADGLFVLRHVSESSEAVTRSVRMDYYNSDGFLADLCLNGTRCAAQLAFHLGWAEDAVEVLTGAGPVAARRLDGESVRLELAAPEAPRAVTVESGGISCAGFRLRVGVPHFVLVWEELERAPVRELGSALRQHPLFEPEGTNVNFVRYPEEHRMEIRTFERGVEDETLACGTGVLAGVAVGLAAGRLALPVRALTRGGFELDVDRAEGSTRWRFGGDARVVAEGALLPPAAV